jgi:hypothetical protein
VPGAQGSAQGARLLTNQTHPHAPSAPPPCTRPESTDRSNFLSLCQELKAALKGRLLTAAVPGPGIITDNAGFNLPALGKVGPPRGPPTLTWRVGSLGVVVP